MVRLRPAGWLTTLLQCSISSQFHCFCVARVCQHQLGFLVDLSLDLDWTVAQRKAQSKVKITHCDGRDFNMVFGKKNYIFCPVFLRKSCFLVLFIIFFAAVSLYFSETVIKYCYLLTYFSCKKTAAGGCGQCWFTLTETEISINGNGNERITKNRNEMETEKFETETDKFRYVCFRFHCISVSCHVSWYGSTNSLWSNVLQCTNKTAYILLPNIRPSIRQTVNFREK